MKTLLILTVVMFAAPPIDKRLAAVHKAYVMAKDDLTDSKPIATCFADHLGKTTPLAPVADKADADVVLTIVQGNITPGPMTLGSALLVATLPDGTRLWGGRETVYNTTGRLSPGPLLLDIPCTVADGLAGQLRAAMRKARDQ